LFFSDHISFLLFFSDHISFIQRKFKCFIHSPDTFWITSIFASFKLSKYTAFILFIWHISYTLQICFSILQTLKSFPSERGDINPDGLSSWKTWCSRSVVPW
jgi:hypothetical protein